MMELWEPYAKQNIVTLYSEQPYNGSWLKFMLMSSTTGEESERKILYDKSQT